jgi:hypothetical protein
LGVSRQHVHQIRQAIGCHAFRLQVGFPSGSCEELCRACSAKTRREG